MVFIDFVSRWAFENKNVSSQNTERTAKKRKTCAYYKSLVYLCTRIAVKGRQKLIP